MLLLSFTQVGVLLILGTSWFGVSCLVNALRCGRAHCWVDGLLLPALAVIGGLNLLAIATLPWSSYLSAFWLILLASVAFVCPEPTLDPGRRSVPDSLREPKIVKRAGRRKNFMPRRRIPAGFWNMKVTEAWRNTA